MIVALTIARYQEHLFHLLRHEAALQFLQYGEAFAWNPTRPIPDPVGAGRPGGMGEVYKARDPRLGRDVTIKILPGSFSSDSERLARFEREARAAAALNHPNILAVFDVGHDGSPYIVSELLTGETLREQLDAGGVTRPQGSGRSNPDLPWSRCRA